MLQRSLNREFGFSINDVARMIRTYADQKARQFGITRAQWVVLVRLDRFEGLKQSELADMLDLQPITLTRLLDRLSASGLIERRADPNDPNEKAYLEELARLRQEDLERTLRELDQECSNSSSTPTT